MNSLGWYRHRASSCEREIACSVLCSPTSFHRSAWRVSRRHNSAMFPWMYRARSVQWIPSCSSCRWVRSSCRVQRRFAASGDCFQDHRRSPWRVRWINPCPFSSGRSEADSKDAATLKWRSSCSCGDQEGKGKHNKVKGGGRMTKVFLTTTKL